MISLKAIRRFKCPFAICIVVAIASVVSCDLLCSLGLISFAKQSPITISTGHSHEHINDHHSSGKKSHQHSHDHEVVEHRHDSQNEEECCDDLTQRFYSSLINSTGSQLNLIHDEFHKLISTLTFFDLNEINPSVNLASTSKFDHKPNGPPGYSGFSIRVLFCSFLI